MEFLPLELLFGYISPRDLLNFSETCHKANVRIRHNLGLWKSWVTRIYSHPFWSTLQLEVDEWIRIAFYTERNEVRVALQEHYIRRCMALPANHADSIRLFASVSTSSLPGDPVILVSDENFVTKHKQHIFTFFRKTQENILVWRGEGGHFSKSEFYMINRRQPGEKIPLQVEMENYKSSILGKKDYSRIGLLLHNDVNFYASESSTSYNGQGGHSQMRQGVQNRFGANSTTSLEAMPLLRVISATFLRAMINLDEVFALEK